MTTTKTSFVSYDYINCISFIYDQDVATGFGLSKLSNNNNNSDITNIRYTSTDIYIMEIYS